MVTPTISYGHGYLTDCQDLYGTTVYTCTSDGNAGGTTTISTGLTPDHDGYYIGMYIKYLTGTNAGNHAMVTGFVEATDTLTHADIGNQTLTGDTFVLSKWVRETGGTSISSTLTQTYDDYFTIEGTCAAAGDEFDYWVYPNENTGHDVHGDGFTLDTNSFTKYYVRWKTSASADALGAGVKLVFSDASTQDLLEATGVPQFSTSWKVTTGTITAGKTLHHIRLYADDYPNTIAAGTSSVQYDFVLLCQGTFTFPFVSNGVHFGGQNRNAKLEPPGRLGDITQYLGSKSSPITVTGNTDSGTGWHDDILMQTDLGILLKICHESNTNPWQWFTCDTPKLGLKVCIDDWDIGSDGGDAAILSYVLNLSEYRRGDASGEAYWERWGTYP